MRVMTTIWSSDATAMWQDWPMSCESLRMTGSAVSTSERTGACAIASANNLFVSTYPEPFSAVVMKPLNSSTCSMRNNSPEERPSRCEIADRFSGDFSGAPAAR